MQQKLSITPNFVYGLQSTTIHNVNFESNEHIIYPAGGVLVVHSLNNVRQQKYVHLHNKLRPLNVVCVSPNKEFIACAEGGDNSEISLYSTTALEYVASLEVPNDVKVQNFACLQFTCDGQFIIAVTGDPDWMLLCYNVAAKSLDSKTRANMAAQPEVPVKQVACNPNDPATLALVGPGLFRLLQLVDGSWRQYGFYKAQNYPLISVTWLTSDRVLAGTEDGRLLLIESNELKGVFRALDLQLICLPGKDDNWEENIPGPSKEKITSIVSFQKGFLLGLGEPCQVVCYKYEPGPKYHLMATYTPSEGDGALNSIWSLAISPDCCTLIASTSRLQLFRAAVSLEVIKGEGKKKELVPFGEPLHQGPVVDLSVCVWRPVFVTCGVLDLTVRLWNYSTGKQELAKRFDSPPISASIHPLGLFVLVAFGDCVCLMCVQLDDLEMIRMAAVVNCVGVKFSPGGQLFAVVYGSNVDVMSTVSFACVASLHGHCAKVEGIAWSQDDTRLITCGVDGAMYTWDTASGARLEEIVTKHSPYFGVSTIASGKTCFLTSGKDSLKVIHEAQMERIVQNDTQIELTVTTVMRNNKTLLVGSKCGTLLAYGIPFNDDELITTFCAIHRAAIKQIVGTYDCKTIVSCSEDGTICIWHLHDGSACDSEGGVPSVEQVLIGRTNLSALRELSDGLSERLRHQQSEKQIALQYQEATFAESEAQMSQCKEKEVAEIRREIKQMESRHLNELEEKMRKLEETLSEHEVVVAGLEDEYQEKLIFEYGRVEQLEKNLAEQRQLFEQITNENKLKSDSEFNELKSKNESVILGLELKIKELERDSYNTKFVHEEVVSQIELDVDKEVIQLKVEHEKALREQREVLERLQGQLQSAKKRISGNQEVIMEFEQRIEQLQAEIEQNKNTIASLEQFIVEQKKLMERNKIILENKERDLMMTKKQVDDLAKEKSNLNLRLDLMTRHIEPKEAAIREKGQELEQMSNELKVERSLRAQLEVEIANLNSQLKQNQKQAIWDQTKHRDTQRDIQRIRARLHQLGAVLQQPRRLAQLAAELYSDFGRDGVSPEENSVEALLELRRQIETLQELNSSLVKKLKTQDEIHRNEKNALKRECISLMKELTKIQNAAALTRSHSLQQLEDD